MFSLSKAANSDSYVVKLGKSDPYVVFTLDGQKVFKSQTKKKTLRPEWNETFAVTVVSVASGHAGYLFANGKNFSPLALRQTSSLKFSTGIKLNKPKAWEPPGSTF
jgi:hypothetical protein